LAAQLLLYPATDPGMSSASFAANGEGYLLTRQDMAWFYRQYLPAGPGSAAEADLARADVADVAPAIVATAEFDPLRDEGAAYAERLKNAGVPTEYVPGPGFIHGFAGFLGVVDAAGANLGTILQTLSRTMRAAAPGQGSLLSGAVRQGPGCALFRGPVVPTDPAGRQPSVVACGGARDGGADGAARRRGPGCAWPPGAAALRLSRIVRVGCR
jgi:hypothetical protein